MIEPEFFAFEKRRHFALERGEPGVAGLREQEHEEVHQIARLFEANLHEYEKRLATSQRPRLFAEIGQHSAGFDDRTGPVISERRRIHKRISQSQAGSYTASVEPAFLTLP